MVARECLRLFLGTDGEIFVTNSYVLKLAGPLLFKIALSFSKFFRLYDLRLEEGNVPIDIEIY